MRAARVHEFMLAKPINEDNVKPAGFDDDIDFLARSYSLEYRRIQREFSAGSRAMRNGDRESDSGGANTPLLNPPRHGARECLSLL